MKRLFVTGATGFVGRQLMQELLQEDLDVVVAGRNPEALRNEYPRATAVSFDLDKPETLASNAFDAVDCVLHLAARVHIMKPTSADERKFSQCNVAATRLLTERAGKAGVRRLVFLSSVKVNGETTQGSPFNDQDPPDPKDAYGQSKAEAENALKETAAKNGTELVIVRPPLVYGPGVGANFLRLLQIVDRGWPLPLRSIHNARSLIARSNLTHFLRHVVRHPNPQGTWMVSDGEDLSTAALCNLIATAMHKPARLVSVPSFFVKGSAQMVGMGSTVRRLVDSLQVDIAHTRRALGWSPCVSAAAEIEATVKWYRESKHGG